MAFNKMKSYSYTDYWSGHFTCQEPHEEEANLLIDFINQFKFYSILELGSGQGYLSKKLKENFTCYLTGLDLISGNPYLDAFIKKDICAFKPQEKYDLIITRNFLMHIKPDDIVAVLFNLVPKSNHFVAVEYYPKWYPLSLASHNFAHNYNGLTAKRISKDRAILFT